MFDEYMQTIDAINMILIPLVTLIVLFVLYKLIKFIYIKVKVKQYQKKLSQSGIRDIDKMDGLQFETYLKALFKELGYKSDVTKSSNDFGADLIMKNNNKRIVIQAKRYKYKNNVSIDAVQQIYASMPYYKAQEAWIITNSFYTNSAYKLAKSCHVKLLNRYQLIDFIQDVNPTVNPDNIKKTINPEKRKCPECDGTLVPRYSKKGNQFMGCSNYPNCKHTEPIAN